jgi:SAM-dependent methyltransferase
MMPGKDAATLAFYAAEAPAYATRSRVADHERLDAFLAMLPAGAAILELGCGCGRDSEAMRAKGFEVTPTDGSPQLAREAEIRLGAPVNVLLFGDLDERDRYDGVWARACLLHVPRNDLAGIIERVRLTLRAGGVFYASFKAGAREGRDRFGRYYNYPTPAVLRLAYGSAGWASVKIEHGLGGGYDRVETEWLHVFAEKAA